MNLDLTLILLDDIIYRLQHCVMSQKCSCVHEYTRRAIAVNQSDRTCSELMMLMSTC